MLRQFLQIIAFFFPSPINVWLHRLAGAKIAKYVSIHPGVLIRAKKIEIGKEAKIKFGAMINVRTFHLGRKSSFGFFTLANGVSDLIVSDASTIGPRCMISCDEEIIIGYYSGIGPGCHLYSHSSYLPVTEGYRTTFKPIHIKNKVWVCTKTFIGPGVTIEEGTIVMPGTVLVENVGSKRLVVGNPAKLNNLPLFLMPRKSDFLDKLAVEILKKYCDWSNEYKNTTYRLEDGVLRIPHGNINFSISVNGERDLALITQKGKVRDGMYFNLADLSTDGQRHPIKLEFEEFLRLYYGLIFLEKI